MHSERKWGQPFRSSTDSRLPQHSAVPRVSPVPLYVSGHWLFAIDDTPVFQTYFAILDACGLNWIGGSHLGNICLSFLAPNCEPPRTALRPLPVLSPSWLDGPHPRHCLGRPPGLLVQGPPSAPLITKANMLLSVSASN